MKLDSYAAGTLKSDDESSSKFQIPKIKQAQNPDDPYRVPKVRADFCEVGFPSDARGIGLRGSRGLRGPGVPGAPTTVNPPQIFYDT